MTKTFHPNPSLQFVHTLNIILNFSKFEMIFYLGTSVLDALAKFETLVCAFENDVVPDKVRELVEKDCVKKHLIRLQKYFYKHVIQNSDLKFDNNEAKLAKDYMSLTSSKFIFRNVHKIYYSTNNEQFQHKILHDFHYGFQHCHHLQPFKKTTNTLLEIQKILLQDVLGLPLYEQLFGLNRSDPSVITGLFSMTAICSHQFLCNLIAMCAHLESQNLHNLFPLITKWHQKFKAPFDREPVPMGLPLIPFSWIELFTYYHDFCYLISDVPIETDRVYFAKDADKLKNLNSLRDDLLTVLSQST